jgi:hypothetical protein
VTERILDVPELAGRGEPVLPAKFFAHLEVTAADRLQRPSLILPAGADVAVVKGDRYLGKKHFIA